MGGAAARGAKMELDKWEASPVPNPWGELFNAIITGHAGTQLIAQCTTMEFAEHIVDLHNGAAESWLARGDPIFYRALRGELEEEAPIEIP